MTDQQRTCTRCLKPIPTTGMVLITYAGTLETAYHLECYRDDQRPAASIAVCITPNDKQNPPGKLADAELHFLSGPLQGLKLIGFAIWERRTGGGRNVTFPARQYSVNGERRSFALLRPLADSDAQDRIRDLILRAYASYDSPGVHTKSLFDDAGHLMTERATPTPATSPSPEPPADLLKASTSGAQVAAAIQAMTPEQVNPGILLGSMTVEKIIGWDSRPTSAPSSAPKARRF